jgi:hypothetical protein
LNKSYRIRQAELLMNNCDTDFGLPANVRQRRDIDRGGGPAQQHDKLRKLAQAMMRSGIVVVVPELAYV